LLAVLSRTDGTVYPVIWGVANAGTQAYSCTAVNIQSSTGTLNATITQVKQVIITDTGGVDKYRISYNASTDSLETTNYKTNEHTLYTNT
jgi:hypothetical protein